MLSTCYLLVIYLFPCHFGSADIFVQGYLYVLYVLCICYLLVIYLLSTCFHATLGRWIYLFEVIYMCVARRAWLSRYFLGIDSSMRQRLTRALLCGAHLVWTCTEHWTSSCGRRTSIYVLPFLPFLFASLLVVLVLFVMDGDSILLTLSLRACLRFWCSCILVS